MNKFGRILTITFQSVFSIWKLSFGIFCIFFSQPVQDTLNIEIMDVNDNRPIFNDKAPSGNIPENDPTPYYINVSSSYMCSQSSDVNGS